MPAVQDLLYQLLNRQKAADQCYYLVVIAEDALPRVEEYLRIEEMIARIREYTEQEVAVFPFLGYYLPISKGPYRYLKTPFGHVLPVFQIPEPDALEFEPHGWLGREQQELEAPVVREDETMTAGREEPAYDAQDGEDDETPVWGN